VIITGTALTPKIGGQVNLFNGQVSLAERAATPTASPTPETTEVSTTPETPATSRSNTATIGDDTNWF
jgi:hypothetical protein